MPLVVTKYRAMGDITVEFVTTINGETITLETNVLLPESTPVLPVIDIPSVAPALCEENTTAEVPIEETPPEEEPTQETTETPAMAQPLQKTLLTTASPTRKERVVPAFIRGFYTVMFSLLGMFSAAVAYLQDNLDKLLQLDWKIYLVVGVGALLSGVAYGLKRFYKPEGKW